SLLDELATKSRVLFANLDRDGKGFIDAGELADFCTDMSEEECQRLFRELDRDGDGRISVADFREGFRLISRTVHQRCEHHEQRRRSSNASTNGLSPKPYSPNSSKANSIDEVEEGGSASAAGGGRRSGISDRPLWRECLQSLSCQDQVFEFYHQLGEERPTLLDNFETVLAELMAVVKALQTEQQRLEQLLSSERQRHAQAIRDLEVEVEHQLKSAEQAVLSPRTPGPRAGPGRTEAARSRRSRVDTETAAYKAELEKIRSEKKALQLDLSGAETRLAIVMSEVATLKQALQDRDQQLRRERESMQEQVREQDRITQQLHLLHQTNRQLRDKNEELREALEASQASAVRLRQQQQPASSRLLQQSHLAESALRICDPNYPNSGRRMDSCDLDSDNPDSGMSTLRRRARLGAHLGVSTDSLQRSQECLSGHSAITTCPGGTVAVAAAREVVGQKPESSPGRQAAAGQEASTSCAIVTVSGNPERMFKVVLAGDAAVGKSSFIMRLCDNRFTENTTATLGVDFKTKIIAVDGRVFATAGVHIPNLFQLWDTAGQERFRSVAKSYFRRADGVLLLFDCHLRALVLERARMGRSGARGCGQIRANNDLLEQDGLETGCQQQGKRVVEYTEARKLAQEYDALFAEVSARAAQNVQMCVTELARLMQASEDLQHNPNHQTLVGESRKCPSRQDDDKGKNAKEKSACCDF
uniref:EF-hand domain-containing protein n=1 Tax=Macrostomum lignano TaxID=282301 RepID=A0A1I8JQ47_9PLAT